MEDIRASCFTENCTCEKGCCDASISQKSEDLFSLVTGIIPNPDYLGGAKFTTSGIKSFSEKKVIIRTNAGELMILEART